MTVKPIDIQTNIGQIHEVARNQHAHDAAVVNQQLSLDKEALDKSQKADTHVDENKESQQVTKLRDDEAGKERRHSAGKKKEEEKEGAAEVKGVTSVDDDRLGNIIDIRK